MNATKRESEPWPGLSLWNQNILIHMWNYLVSKVYGMSRPSAFLQLSMLCRIPTSGTRSAFTGLSCICRSSWQVSNCFHAFPFADTNCPQVLSPLPFTRGRTNDIPSTADRVKYSPRVRSNISGPSWPRTPAQVVGLAIGAMAVLVPHCASDGWGPLLRRTRPHRPTSMRRDPSKPTRFSGAFEGSNQFQRGTLLSGVEDHGGCSQHGESGCLAQRRALINPNHLECHGACEQSSHTFSATGRRQKSKCEH